MYRVFNMGLGMVMACDQSHVAEVLAQVPGSLEVGEVVEDAGRARVIL
jgi:phosphoribosylaminoimidazole (AIR) synthetase